MKIKFFKKEKKFKKDNSLLNINLYWELAVCFMFITTLGAFYFGYNLFNQINKEAVLEAGSTSGQVETVKRDRIDKVLNYFTLRDQKSTEIITTPAPVVDPSL